MRKMITIIFILMIFISCEDENSSKNNSTDDKDLITNDDTASKNDFDDESVDISENDTVSLNDIDEETQDEIVPDDDVYEETQDDVAENNDVPDDIGTMVEIPAGSFMMGCSDGGICKSSESPAHEVTLSTYQIDKYEVTAGEYQKCIDAGDCNNSNEDEPHYMTSGGDAYPCNLGYESKKNHPMNCVSWYGAKAYCEWLGKHLPTEAQWEKAARGADSRTYPWGNQAPSCEYAVMFPENTTSYGCGTDRTWIVGSKEKGASPYGLYDMAGNAQEWVNDWFNETYYAESPVENPSGPETGAWKILRGGSYISSEEKLRTTGRDAKAPYFEGSGYIGFAVRSDEENLIR